MNKRRTIRVFSDKPVPRQVIENIIRYLDKNYLESFNNEYFKLDLYFLDLLISLRL